MQSATERYLKEKKLYTGHRELQGVSQLKRNPSQNYTSGTFKFLLQRQLEVSASTTKERKASIINSGDEN